MLITVSSINLPGIQPLHYLWFHSSDILFLENWRNAKSYNFFSKSCLNTRTIAQIPQCTNPTSHNAPFYNRNVHVSVTKWWNVGYSPNVLWDLWDGDRQARVQHRLLDHWFFRVNYSEQSILHIFMHGYCNHQKALTVKLWLNVSNMFGYILIILMHFQSQNVIKMLLGIFKCDLVFQNQKHDTCHVMNRL